MYAIYLLAAVHHNAVAIEEIIAAVDLSFARYHELRLRIKIPDRIILHVLHARHGRACKIVQVSAFICLNEAPLYEEDFVTYKTANQQSGKPYGYANNEFLIHC